MRKRQSDTPRVDALWRAMMTSPRREMGIADLARELEREGARLRKLLKRARCHSDGTWALDIVREIDAALSESAGGGPSNG